MADRTPRIPAHVFWPGLVIVVLGLSLASGALTIVAATGDPSFAIEPDYYDKALAWDEHARRLRDSEALGWTARLGVGADADALDRRTLTLSLTDASGELIRDASVTVVAYHQARSGERLSLTLEPGETGAYTAPLAVGRTGLWEFRVEAKRDAAAFLDTQQIWVNPAPRVARP